MVPEVTEFSTFSSLEPPEYFSNEQSTELLDFFSESSDFFDFNLECQFQGSHSTIFKNAVAPCDSASETPSGAELTPPESLGYDFLDAPADDAPLNPPGWQPPSVTSLPPQPTAMVPCHRGAVIKKTDTKAQLRRQRNTEAARRSRGRTKQRVVELEDLVKHLMHENQALRQNSGSE